MEARIRTVPMILALLLILPVVFGCNRGTTEQKIATLQRDARNLAQQAVADQKAGRPGSAQTRYHEAVSAYHEIIALDPDSDGAYLNLGILHNFFGDYEKANESLEKALAINPDKARAYFYKGFIQFKNGDKREAEISFKMSIDRNPDYPPAQFYYGKVEFQLGEHFRAKTALEKYLELAPNGSFSDLANGYIELLPEEFSSPPAAGILPLPLEPGTEDDITGETPVPVSEPEPEPEVEPEPEPVPEPEPEVEEPAVAENPEPEPVPEPEEPVIVATPDPEPEPEEPVPDPEPVPEAPLKYADHIEIGQFALAVDDAEGALESFKRAYQIEPLFAEVNSLLGKTYRKLGEYDKGIAHLKVVLSRSEDDPGALLELGYCYEGKGEIERALGYFDRYLLLVDREDIREHVDALRAG